MSTYILTWNPDAYVVEVGYYLEHVEDVATDGPLKSGRWGTGVRNSEIVEGDRVFLFRQKRQRGIVASGYCTSESYQDTHWRDGRRNANYVDINWDIWKPLDQRLSIDDLENKVPGFSWNHLQGSGIHIHDTNAALVEKLWAN